MSEEGFYESEEEAEEYLAGVYSDFEIDPVNAVKFAYGFKGDQFPMKVVVDLLAKQPFDFRPLALDEDEYGPAGEPRFSYVVERSARLTPRDLLAELLQYQKIADQAGVRFTGITASSYQ